MAYRALLIYVYTRKTSRRRSNSKPLIEEFNETAEVQQKRLQVINKAQARIELLKELLAEQG